MKALVIYESQYGHTRKAAEAIAEAVTKQGGEAVVKYTLQVKPADVQNADAVFIGTWVHGLILFGVRPAGVKDWLPNLPPLTGKPVGVYCTYQFNPRGALRSLGIMLAERGAVIKGERAFHNSKPGEGADVFVKGVLERSNLSLN